MSTLAAVLQGNESTRTSSADASVRRTIDADRPRIFPGFCQPPLDFSMLDGLTTPRQRMTRRTTRQRREIAAPVSPAALVIDFHEAFDLPRRAYPSADIGAGLAELR